ncbi:MAG: ASCH domain-containing protein [Planctomycetes bacterium]|nr:ASCH domain-containing protein [Planctomycetota bacterium]
MKALTIKQPWAGLIAAGIKPIENRTWRTWYRGPLLIHASRRWTSKCGELARFARTAASLEDVPSIPSDEEMRAYCGRLLCKVNLVDCVKIGELPPTLRGHWAAAGPWCWILEGLVLVPSLPAARGKLSLWEWPVSTVAEVVA